VAAFSARRQLRPILTLVVFPVLSALAWALDLLPLRFFIGAGTLFLAIIAVGIVTAIRSSRTGAYCASAPKAWRSAPGRQFCGPN
jgi:hypothetical protein